MVKISFWFLCMCVVQVRFHILSEYELHQRRSVGHISDSHLNLQQLSKSLLGLFNLYSANSHEKHTNEAEFRAYYVLLNLGSNNRYQVERNWFEPLLHTYFLSIYETNIAGAYDTNVLIFHIYCFGTGGLIVIMVPWVYNCIDKH